MLRRTLTPIALMMLMLLTPAALLAAPQNDAGQKVLGKWEVKSLDLNGETEEVPAGEVMVKFMADGKMKSWESGEEEDGTYKIEGDNITFYEAGAEEGETFKFTVNDTTMTISQGDENFKITVTLARMAE